MSFSFVSADISCTDAAHQKNEEYERTKKKKVDKDLITKMFMSIDCPLDW
jgi:hypothetical protein